MILSVAVLVSHLAGAPPLSSYQPEPAELQRARRLMLSRPGECVALTHFFLQRKEAKPASMFNSRQELDKLEQAKRYRTRGQTFTAWQLQALCQANDDQLLTADASINQAISLARRHRQSDALVTALLIKAKLALASEHADQAQTLLDEAQKAILPSDLTLMGDLQLLQATLLMYRHRYDEARQLLEQVRLQALQQDDALHQSWANFLLGDYYLQLQQDELALSHFLETLDVLGDRRQFYVKALAAKKTAAIYAALGQNDKALQFANQSTTEFEQLGNSPLLISSLLNLGRVTRAGDDANLALVYFFNALDLVKIQGDTEQMAALYLEIGQSYSWLGSYKEAQHYLDLARTGFERTHDLPHLADTLIQLGKMHLAQTEYGVALLRLERARIIAEQLDDVVKLMETHRLLAQLFEQSGNMAAALTHQKALHAYFQRATNVNRLLTQSLVQDNELQLQQERELSELGRRSEKLLQDRERFALLAAGLSLLSPLLLYGLLRNHIRSRRLWRQNQELQQSLLIEPLTGLPNWRKLMQRLPKEMARQQQRSEQWYLNEELARPFDDKIYYLLLQVPFMSSLRERLGLAQSTEIQQQLGAYLRGRIHPRSRLYDLRDGQFIYAIPQKEVAELAPILTALERMFAEFPCQYELDRRIFTGIIGHPFLPKAPNALDDLRLGDILYLALAGARQLAEITQESAWVELVAVDCQQAAFFTGDVRSCCIQGIMKGLVKVNSSHKKQQIDWQALQPELPSTHQG
ncbi:tetratricopeptide repeat protein [Oceanimonas baumannii]|uniref:tetratricopeptide repeat protein n=1 Tax=Oceanimonas baumannii TaxID=129578 RepID=UPI001D189180|nr:tetratricopeptide repeat protein [Oceanimonas baumannii]MCC4263128.1 tetratricopeptide repeat protein [Oceanimonas baumannii]